MVPGPRWRARGRRRRRRWRRHRATGSGVASHAPNPKRNVPGASLTSAMAIGTICVTRALAPRAWTVWISPFSSPRRAEITSSRLPDARSATNWSGTYEIPHSIGQDPPLTSSTTRPRACARCKAAGACTSSSFTCEGSRDVAPISVLQINRTIVRAAGRAAPCACLSAALGPSESAPEAARPGTTTRAGEELNFFLRHPEVPTLCEQIPSLKLY